LLAGPDALNRGGHRPGTAMETAGPAASAQKKKLSDPQDERSGEPYRMLPGKTSATPISTPRKSRWWTRCLKKFKDTRAIIFDDRAYSKGTAWPSLRVFRKKFGDRRPLHAPLAQRPDDPQNRPDAVVHPGLLSKDSPNRSVEI